MCLIILPLCIWEMNSLQLFHYVFLVFTFHVRWRQILKFLCFKWKTWISNRGDCVPIEKQYAVAKKFSAQGINVYPVVKSPNTFNLTYKRRKLLLWSTHKNYLQLYIRLDWFNNCFRYRVSLPRVTSIILFSALLRSSGSASTAGNLEVTRFAQKHDLYCFIFWLCSFRVCIKLQLSFHT